MNSDIVSSSQFGVTPAKMASYPVGASNLYEAGVANQKAATEQQMALIKGGLRYRQSRKKRHRSNKRGRRQSRKKRHRSNKRGRHQSRKKRYKKRGGGDEKMEITPLPPGGYPEPKGGVSINDVNRSLQINQATAYRNASYDSLAHSA